MTRENEKSYLVGMFHGMLIVGVPLLLVIYLLATSQ